MNNFIIDETPNSINPTVTRENLSNVIYGDNNITFHYDRETNKRVFWNFENKEHRSKLKSLIEEQLTNKTTENCVAAQNIISHRSHYLNQITFLDWFDDKKYKALLDNTIILRDNLTYVQHDILNNFFNGYKENTLLGKLTDDYTENTGEKIIGANPRVYERFYPRQAGSTFITHALIDYIIENELGNVCLCARLMRPHRYDCHDVIIMSSKLEDWWVSFGKNEPIDFAFCDNKLREFRGVISKIPKKAKIIAFETVEPRRTSEL